MNPNKKKKRKPFVSSSETPPEHMSDTEATLTVVDSSHENLRGTPDHTTDIPIPKPRTLSRTQSPYGSEAIGGVLPFEGSAPVKPSYINERGPTPEPRPRSKTPSSAGGSKNQSPTTSGSDIAMLDSARSDSTSSQKSVGVSKKPTPPPKPPKIASLDDKSMEAYKFCTLPHGRALKGGASPPKPAKQLSIPISNSSHSPSMPSLGVSSGTPPENRAKKVAPPKPVRNFACKADLPSETDATPTTTLPLVGTKRPGSGGDTGETSPTLGSAATATAMNVSSQPGSSTPPTPRQRPPPKPARSVRRKPQRERANLLNLGEEETPSNEVELPEIGTVTPPRSNSDSSDKGTVVTEKVTATLSSGGAGRPPKPIRRIKSPKIVDSLSPQMEEEKERTSSETFGDRDKSSRGSTGDGNETGTKPAVRTLNVSTPSPTSSSPTNTNEGGNSFAEAAEYPHSTSVTTAELAKSVTSRFEADATPSSSTTVHATSSSKPRLMPKPRGLQFQGVTGSANPGTPRRPTPPSKPSRSSVKVAASEHRT